jgi:hypothetical protein
MHRPETELRHSNIPPGVRSTRRLVAYLLRATRLRIREDAVGRERLRALSGELADALLATVASCRSPLAFYRAICTRFAVDPTGGDHEFGPIEAWLPAGSGPSGRIRWDHACAAIDYGDLRTVVRESPDFLATFACARGDEADDSLFEAFPDPPAGSSYRPALPAQMISPRSHRAVWTLTSPAFHGADTKTGNVQLFRRHAVPDPLTGMTHEVPFIAGNATRGMLRDIGAGMHLGLLGLRSTDIPTSRAHALLSGGSIEKGADTGTVDNVLRSRARELCPPWDLFAGCVDQQIMSGRGRVSDATLVCRETAWKVAEIVAPGRAPMDLAADLPSCEELMEIRQLTRHKHADIPDAEGVQMLVSFELVREGSQFAHSVQLWGVDQVSEIMTSFLACLLEEFRAIGSLGVGAARGFGSVAFDGYKPGPGTPQLPSPDIYREAVERRRQEMIDWVMAVGAPGPAGRTNGRRANGRRGGRAEAEPAE